MLGSVMKRKPLPQVCWQKPSGKHEELFSAVELGLVAPCGHPACFRALGSFHVADEAIYAHVMQAVGMMLLCHVAQWL